MDKKLSIQMKMAAELMKENIEFKEVAELDYNDDKLIQIVVQHKTMNSNKYRIIKDAIKKHVKIKEAGQEPHANEEYIKLNFLYTPDTINNQKIDSDDN